MNGLVWRLDDWGKPAWIAAMILGFVVFWPVGLFILFYMIGSGRMGCGHGMRAGFGPWSEHRKARWDAKMERMQEKLDRWRAFRERAFSPAQQHGFAPSGNRAFDEYRSETLRRLEEEAQEFRDFLDNLRHAKDKAEFDQFMNDRRTRPTAPAKDDEAPRAS